ncbi:MAG: dioxygenase [Acidimicrobiales bacterium]|nr:MAG: dioxygenase [Acidimicrobiales bacterium]
MDETREWYRAFGLTEHAPGALATRDGGVQLRLEDAPYRGIRRIGLGVDDPDDLARLAAALKAADEGMEIEHGETLRFRDPVDRLPYEISVAPRYDAASVDVPAVNRPSAVERRDVPADAVLRGSPVQPSNLTHFVRGTRDPVESIRFHTEVLGFELSDALGDFGGFMRCSDVHHNMAVQKAPAAFLHHISFECDDVDEVGRGAAHMLELDGDSHVWGLGRHAIGSNYFWYLRDPSGNFAEYSSDIDRISSQDGYHPKDWNDGESLSSWGPPVPISFLAPPDIEEVFAAMAEG